MKWQKPIREIEQLEMENGTLYYSEKLQLWIYQYHFNNNRKTLKQRKKETVKDFKARVTKIKNE